MRRLLRDIAENRILSDTTTLTDPVVMKEIKEAYEQEEDIAKNIHTGVPIN